MTDEQWMTRAIRVCREGMREGQSPFGAVIVRGDSVLAESHNSTSRDHDPTAHAEINAIRTACRLEETSRLAGTTLYSTCEPCPMCLAAILWADVDRVVFGASIADAAAAGFAQFPIAASHLADLAGRRLILTQGVLPDVCVGLFDEWKSVRE